MPKKQLKMNRRDYAFRNRAIKKHDAVVPMCKVHVYITGVDSPERIEFSFVKGHKIKYDLLIDSIDQAIVDHLSLDIKINESVTVAQEMTHGHNRKFTFVAKRVNDAAAYRLECSPSESKELSALDISALFSLRNHLVIMRDGSLKQMEESYNKNSVKMRVSMGAGPLASLRTKDTFKGVAAELHPLVNKSLLKEGLKALAAELPSPSGRAQIMMDSKGWETEGFQTFKRFDIYIDLDETTGEIKARVGRNAKYEYDEDALNAIWSLITYYTR